MTISGKQRQKAPYKGAVPFSEADSLIFFGRDNDCARIIDNLVAWRLTVLYGASGVGKSSLLRAGVAHSLNIKARMNAIRNDKPGWAAIVFPPLEGALSERCSWSEPVRGIAFQLKETLDKFGIAPSEPLEQKLTLIEIFRIFLDSIQDNRGEKHLYLMLDQMEDYLLDWTQENDRFAEQLAQALHDDDISISCLMAIREDALSQLGYFDKYVHNLFHERLQINDLTEAAARDAIEKPIQKFNEQAVLLDSWINSKITMLVGEGDIYQRVLLDAVADCLSWTDIEDLQDNVPNPLSVMRFKGWRSHDNPAAPRWEPFINGMPDYKLLGSADAPYTFASARGLRQRLTACDNNARLFAILDGVDEIPEVRVEEFVDDLTKVVNESCMKVHFLVSVSKEEFARCDPIRALASKAAACDSCLYLLKRHDGVDIITHGPEPSQPELRYGIDPELAERIIAGVTEDPFDTGTTSRKAKQASIESYILQVVVDQIWRKEVETLNRQATSSQPVVLKKQTFLGFSGRSEYEERKGSGEPDFPQDISKEAKSVYIIVRDYLLEILGDPTTSVETPGKGLKDDEKVIAASIFHYMITSRGYKIPYHPSELSELSAEYLGLLKHTRNLDENTLKALLDKLSKPEQRILRRRHDGRFEVIHDKLCRQLLEWSNRFVDGYRDRLRATYQMAMRLFLGMVLADKLPTEMSLNQHRCNLLLALEAFNYFRPTEIPVAEMALLQGLQKFPVYKPEKFVSQRLGGDQQVVVASATGTHQRWIAGATQHGVICVWDTTRPGDKPSTLASPSVDPITCLALSGDGRYLASGNKDGTVHVWGDPTRSANWKASSNHPGGINAMAISDNSQWLITAGKDGFIQRYRLTDFSANKTLCCERLPDHHHGPIRSLAISLDGQVLATGGDDKTACLWELSTLGLIHRFRPGGSRISAIEISNNRLWLAVGYLDGKIHVYEISKIHTGETHEYIYALSDCAGSVRVLRISSDIHWLVSGGDDKNLRLWDLFNLDAPPRMLRGHKAPITTAVFAPGRDHWLASGGEDGTACIWELPDTAPAVVVDEYDKRILAMTFANDDQMLAIMREKHGLEPWSLQRSNFGSRILNPKQWGVYALATAGDMIAAGTFWDGKVRLWVVSDLDSAAPKEIHLPGDTPLKARVRNLAFSASRKWLIACHERGDADRAPEALIWNLEGLVQPVHLQCGGEIQALAFTQDDRWLVTVSDNGRALLWDMERLETEGRLTYLELLSLPTAIRSLVVSPDDHWLALGSDDSYVRLFDLQAKGTWTGDAGPMKLEPNSREIRALAVCPKGRWLAAGGSDGTVCLYDLADLTVRPVILTGNARNSHFNILSFSPDCKWLLSCNTIGHTEDSAKRKSSACLWNMENLDSHQALKPILLQDHERVIYSAAFSADPNHEWLATGSADQTARLWKLQDLRRNPAVQSIVIRPLPIYREGSREIRAVAFWKDWLVTAGEDGTVRLWDLRLERLIDASCSIIARNMTCGEWMTYFPHEPYRKTCKKLPVHLSVIQDKLLTARKYVDAGEREEARLAYRQAVQWAEGHKDADVDCAIGRLGCVHNFAEVVMPACERAVTLEPGRIGCRDTLALACALSGKYDKALEQLEYSDNNRGGTSAEIYLTMECKVKRAYWIKELKAGHNPFDGSTLKSFLGKARDLGRQSCSLNALGMD